MPSFESYPFAPPPEQAPSEPKQNLPRPHTPDQRPLQERPELRDLVEKEVDALIRFFGYDIEVPPLPILVTPERRRAWREKGMDLHYLPPEELREERDLPGWRRKPTRKFFERTNRATSSRDLLRLPGYWILIERREKQSRLGFSWEDLHLPGFTEMIARQLGVPPESVRPARAIELNYLANAFNEEHWPLPCEENHGENSEPDAATEPHRDICRPPLVVILSTAAESVN